MRMNIYFAPLEGITGYLFRNAYNEIYGHIDKYFAPFISPSEKCPITPRERKDVTPENNKGINLVPQLLTCRSDHFIEGAKELQAMGYYVNSKAFTPRQVRAIVKQLGEP